MTRENRNCEKTFGSSGRIIKSVRIQIFIENKRNKLHSTPNGVAQFMTISFYKYEIPSGFFYKLCYPFFWLFCFFSLFFVSFFSWIPKRSFSLHSCFQASAWEQFQSSTLNRQNIFRVVRSKAPITRDENRNCEKTFGSSGRIIKSVRIQIFIENKRNKLHSTPNGVAQFMTISFYKYEIPSGFFYKFCYPFFCLFFSFLYLF